MRLQQHKCDECGDIIPETRSGIWLKHLSFEYKGTDYTVPDIHPTKGFVDFCNIPCMILWINKTVSKIIENGKNKIT